jgi:hypothetical protein
MQGASAAEWKQINGPKCARHGTSALVGSCPYPTKGGTSPFLRPFPRAGSSLFQRFPARSFHLLRPPAPTPTPSSAAQRTTPISRPRPSSPGTPPDTSRRASGGTVPPPAAGVKEVFPRISHRGAACGGRRATPATSTWVATLALLYGDGVVEPPGDYVQIVVARSGVGERLSSFAAFLRHARRQERTPKAGSLAPTRRLRVHPYGSRRLPRARKPRRQHERARYLPGGADATGFTLTLDDAQFSGKTSQRWSTSACSRPGRT